VQATVILLVALLLVIAMEVFRNSF